MSWRVRTHYETIVVNIRFNWHLILLLNSNISFHPLLSEFSSTSFWLSIISYFTNKNTSIKRNRILSCNANSFYFFLTRRLIYGLVLCIFLHWKSSVGFQFSAGKPVEIAPIKKCNMQSHKMRAPLALIVNSLFFKVELLTNYTCNGNNFATIARTILSWRATHETGNPWWIYIQLSVSLLKHLQMLSVH